MDEANVRSILRLCRPGHEAKVQLLLEYAAPVDALVNDGLALTLTSRSSDSARLGACPDDARPAELARTLPLADMALPIVVSGEVWLAPYPDGPSAGFTSGLIGANQTLLAPPPTYVLLNNAVSTSATINNDSYGDGTDVFFKLGTLVNNDNDSNAEYVVLEFNALVLNTIVNQAGVPLSNSYVVTISPNASSIQVGPNSNTETVVVVEPQLINIGKEYTSQTLPNGQLSATFDVSFSNANGPFSSTAFDTRVLDQLAPFLALTPNTLTVIRNGFFTLG